MSTASNRAATIDDDVYIYIYIYIGYSTPGGVVHTAEGI